MTRVLPPNIPRAWLSAGIPSLAILSAGALSLPADAGLVSTWIAVSGGKFSDGMNWSPAVPGESDTALFAAPGEFLIEIDEPSLVDRVIVRDGQVTLVSTNPLDAVSGTALLPSWVIGDTAGPTPALVVQGGSLFGRFMEIAAVPDSSGSLEIAPDGIVELADILSVGPRGTATVDVNGQLVARRLVAGGLAAGHGTVALQGAEASATLDELVTAGQKGFGSVAISAQAACLSESMIVALDAYSTGLVVVDGPESTLDIAGSVDIGRNGAGAVEVRNGATATFGGDVVLGLIPETFLPPIVPGGDGTLVVEGTGSTLAVGGLMWVPMGGIAQVEVRDGGRIEVGSIKFNKPLAASLEIEVDGTDGGPAIAVAGTVTSGTSAAVACTVTFGRGVTPSDGDTYPLISAASISSSFDVALPPVPAPLTITAGIESIDGQAVLLVRIDAQADLNDDGLVNGADLGILLSNWGTAGPGDLNADGVVDGADVGILLSYWTP